MFLKFIFSPIYSLSSLSSSSFLLARCEALFLLGFGSSNKYYLDLLLWSPGILSISEEYFFLGEEILVFFCSCLSLGSTTSHSSSEMSYILFFPFFLSFWALLEAIYTCLALLIAILEVAIWDLSYNVYCSSSSYFLISYWFFCCICWYRPWYFYFSAVSSASLSINFISLALSASGR